VLEECIDIRFGAMFALFSRHLVCFSLFSKLDRTGSLSPCLAAGKLEQHRNRIEPPVDRLSTKAEVQDGKSVTRSAQPNCAS
jgi:hypothetical protein